MDTRANPERAHELVLTRVVDAPPGLVFDAWSKPEHLVHWWGPRGFTLPEYEMDFRPGGAFRFHMRGPDRDARLRGTYLEIAPPERLVFTFAWEDEAGRPGHETVVTLSLEPHGDGRTKLTLRQRGFASAAEATDHEDGWSQAVERLAGYAPGAAARGHDGAA